MPTDPQHRLAYALLLLSDVLRRADPFETVCRDAVGSDDWDDATKVLTLGEAVDLFYDDCERIGQEALDHGLLDVSMRPIYTQPEPGE